MSEMLLEVVTPERKVYSDKVNMVIVRGVEGELGILPKHTPFVTPLVISIVRIKKEEKEELITISGGFLEVNNNHVTILAEAAELPEEIDIDRVMRAKERAERRLAQKGDKQIDQLRAEMALKRALNRLKATKQNY